MLPEEDPGSAPTKQASTALIVLAFSAVYVIWGSTYLAIKYAIDTLPPFMMAATRFLTAGAILFTWAKLRGATVGSDERRASTQWRRAFIIGGLLLLGGNGGLTWSERYLSSGLAALLVATEPLWVVMFNWISGAKRPSAKVWLGLFIGLTGVGVLVSGTFGGNHVGTTMSLIGAGVVVLSSMSWAGGSVFSIHRPVQTAPALASGMQMLCGGSLLLLMSLITGEFSRLDLKHASWVSLGALLYLTVFGSIVVFTAYIFLLRNVSPARAATYAYVNPVVAVLLGWAIAGETLTLRTIAGAAIIVGSVVLITTCDKQPEKLDSPRSAPQESAASGADIDPCPTHPCA